MAANAAPRVQPKALRDLRDHLAGELVVPGDPVYDERRRVWKRMIDRRPALIARAASAEDARLALLFAREHSPSW
jgi:hypothetical protein